MEHFVDAIRIIATDKYGMVSDSIHKRLWFRLCKGVWFVGLTEIER